MGSLFSKPKIPAPPPPPELKDFRSDITGIERVAVKGADGKTTIVERRILSDEQKELENRLKDIADSQLQRINELTNNFDVDDIEGLSNILDDFKSTQQDILNNSLDKRMESEEESLAKFGLADSTAATELRNTRSKDRQELQKQLTRDESLLKQQIRSDEINKSANLLGIVQNKENNINNNIMANLNNATNIQNGLLNANTSYNNSLMQSQIARAQLQLKSQDQNFKNLTSLANLALMASGNGGFGGVQ